MSIAAAQQQFTVLIAKLVIFATQNGYGLTYGEAYRTPEQAAWDAAHGTGILHSLHTERLAVDFNVFRGGLWLTSVDDYRPLGEYWEGLDKWCFWGGRFASPDADHFSYNPTGDGRK